MSALKFDPRLINQPGVNRIIQPVCREFGVTVSDLLSPRKFEPLATGRAVAMYFLREQLRWRFKDISRAFNRSSVHAAFCACHRIKAWRAAYPRMNRRITAIETALKGEL